MASVIRKSSSFEHFSFFQSCFPVQLWNAFYEEHYKARSEVAILLCVHRTCKTSCKYTSQVSPRPWHACHAVNVLRLNDTIQRGHEFPAMGNELVSSKFQREISFSNLSLGCSRYRYSIVRQKNRPYYCLTLSNYFYKRLIYFLKGWLDVVKIRFLYF